MHRLVFSSKLLAKFQSITCLTKVASARLPTIKTNIKRSLQSGQRHNRMPKTPDLIYMPHVFRWLKSKLSFKYLQKTWDPDFSEGAFIYGSTKAVCRVTEIIHSGKLEELNGLLTDSARFKLEDDVNHRLKSDQRKLIAIKPQDIKILVPIAVNMTREGAMKICRVNLRMLALKWHEVNAHHYRLVLVALQAEFLRDYNELAAPDWNISSFAVLECAMLSEATAT